MSPRIILVLLAIMLAATAIGAITYVVLRKLRGTLRIDFPDRTYGPGDTVCGNVYLLAKKPIESHHLSVRLQLIEIYRVTTDDSSRSAERTIWQTDQRLLEAQELPAGFEETFSFELTLPQHSESGGLDKWIKALSTGLFTGSFSRHKWQLQAQLDAKGIDLFATENIKVST